ncbi:methylated-DNA--[protein]-cysteine S-methyltransferase [Actimicrobium sp. CCC2.4]|uniref:methylated-DNA--[protein]-cysteine S-methyltransferase n=1 Tax=Actimicrobium sp. CCC2.4 TaxID=3048606 RepID=UPI002AC98CAF|nr:methylated-DNA--[protein]-cysteine S-methyltransferase [Actimicrobium sp. CCC2.4]MEB0135990.1 methylated-DNA--[protein]-cysteine S-methyltransferase [Actimicrobium sp. CCC2.4]WPX32653.1 methylated-DNA--[protein]-cysteine S-methyltransferase [Actimicrobium sp. CCC2.4]
MSVPTTSYLHHPSPLGELVLAATAHGLCGVYFEQHRYFQGTGDWQHDPAQAHLRAAAQQLDDYFAGARTMFDLPLDLTGTVFQRSVWQMLGSIGYGITSSYGKQAERLGRPAAVRAVGTAIGRNPVSIVVPCHRVLGRHGALSGYAGGLDRKQFLLDLESRRSDFPC